MRHIKPDPRVRSKRISPESNPEEMPSAERVGELLVPFGVTLSSGQANRLLVYLGVLQKWNRSINLTAIRSAEECVTRHFGECLYLGRWVRLQGRNLDVGSGAGFPALALKIIFPQVAMTLLEPVAKKRAFLKEVVRTCEMRDVEVRPERLAEYARNGGGSLSDSVTSRAVGDLATLAAQASACVVANGILCFWTTRPQAEDVRGKPVGIEWDAPIPIPGSRKRVLLIGRKVST